MTVKEYLEKLPLKYRYDALYNHSKYNKKLDATPNSISDALILAFKWNKTIEGYSYWEQCYKESKTDFYEPPIIIPKRIINSVYIKKKPVKSKTIKVKEPYKKIKEEIEEFNEPITRYGIVYKSLDDALESVFKRNCRSGDTRNQSDELHYDH